MLLDELVAIRSRRCCARATRVRRNAVRARRYARAAADDAAAHRPELSRRVVAHATPGPRFAL